MIQNPTRRLPPLVGWIAKGISLLFFAAILPACYKSKSYSPPPGGGAGALFTEAFVSYPSSSWNGPTVSMATATSFYAPPYYYLKMSDTARPGSASTTTVMTFMAQPITFSVDLEVSATSALADTESIQILDSTSAAVLASAVYDASTGMITFTIGATSFTPVALSTGAFHTVTFKVDASHNATWTTGATTTSPAAAFGTPTLRLGLRADFAIGAPAAPNFFFANVLVTSP
jgi:hypothetical protein